MKNSFCLGHYSNASDDEDEFNIKTSKKILIRNLPAEFPSTELLNVFRGCGTVHKIIRFDEATQIHFMESRAALMAISNTYINEDTQFEYCYPYLSQYLCIDGICPGVSESDIADFFDRIGSVEVNIDRDNNQALVTMETTTEAVMAREFLHGGYLGSQRVTLDFVDEKFVEKFVLRKQGGEYVNQVIVSWTSF